MPEISGRLVLEDLDEVLDEIPERLLVGTGVHGRLRPDPGTLETLRARGSKSRCSRPRKPSGATPSSIRGRRRWRCT